MHLCSSIAWAGQSWFIWLFLSLQLGRDHKFLQLISALFLMAIVWEVLLQGYIPPPLMLFCWESLRESLLLAIWLICPNLWEKSSHQQLCECLMQSLQLLAGQEGSSWRFRTNCKVCSGSVPRSSWTGCWLKAVTPPWFITEVIVCVWFYTGDLWASVLPSHQLLSISDAVTWACWLSPSQKGTIKDVFKVYGNLFVKPSQNNENTAFSQGRVFIWVLQSPSSAGLFP